MRLVPPGTPHLEQVLAAFIHQVEVKGKTWYELEDGEYLTMPGIAVELDDVKNLAVKGWIRGRTVHTTVWGIVDPNDLDLKAGRKHEFTLTDAAYDYILKERS